MLRAQPPNVWRLRSRRFYRLIGKTGYDQFKMSLLHDKCVTDEGAPRELVAPESLTPQEQDAASGSSHLGFHHNERFAMSASRFLREKLFATSAKSY